MIIIQALKIGAIPGIDQDPDAAAEQFAPNNFIRVTRYDVFMSPETPRKNAGDQVGNIYFFNDRIILHNIFNFNISIYWLNLSTIYSRMTWKIVCSLDSNWIP